MTDNRKLSYYNRIFHDVFELFAKNYKKPPETPEEWHALLMEAECKNREYIGTSLEMFSVRLLALVLLELEDITKTNGIQDAITEEMEGAKQ